MDENKNIAYEKSSDFDSVAPTPAPIPSTAPSSRIEAKSNTNPKPETKKDNLQYK